MFELKFHSVPSARRLSKVLKPGETLGVGREEGELQFPEDGLMSSFHMTLTASSHSVTFLDEGSTNGSFLNGQRVRQGTLGADDTLVIGQTHITLAVTRDPEYKRPQPEKIERTNQAPVARAAAALRIEGSEATERVLQPGQQLSVGRTDKSEWIFPQDDLMSGRHFVLSDANGQWEVCDCNSLNGTFLNDERIDQALLKSGDTIDAGRGSFRVWFEKIDALGRLATIESHDEPVAATSFTPNPKDSVSDTVSELAHTAHVWLADLTGQGMSLCLKQGSQVRAQCSDNKHSRLCIDWTGSGCSVYVEGTTGSEFLINDQLARRAELREGDVLRWSDMSYQVLYAENPQTTVLPTSSPKEASPLSDTQPLIEPGVDELPSDSKEPVPSLDEAEIITPVLVKAATQAPAPARGTDSDNTINSSQGTLPAVDPIEMLLAVSRQGRCWLISIDPAHADQLSVPVEITSSDPSWMMQIQAGWPTNFFMVVFADAAAEDVLLTLLEKTPKPLSFSAGKCIDWLKADEQLWKSTPLRAALLIDSPRNAWWLFSGNRDAEGVRIAIESASGS